MSTKTNSTTFPPRSPRGKSILAIDATTQACSVALGNDQDIDERFQNIPRQHANVLLPFVDQLLENANIQLNQLACIAYAYGPGSFTGIRLAASVVQGLAFAAKLPVIQISSLQLIAQTAYRETQAEKISVALNAFMQEIYFGQYQLDNQDLMRPIKQDQLLKPNDVPINSDFIKVGDGWECYNLTKADAQLYPHAKDLIPLAIQEYNKGNTINPTKLEPIYLRGKSAWK